jgi:hypothetical protein
MSQPNSTQKDRLMTATEVLEQFVNDINVAGGIAYDRKGLPRPVGDPDWIDLGFTYLKACQVLKVEPEESGMTEDELYEDEM